LSAPHSRGTACVVAVVVAVVLGLGVSCNGFREDEIECEHAVVHMSECCPELQKSLFNCEYTVQRSCGGNVTGYTYPALSLEDSRCIQDRSCAELVNGMCARALVTKPRVTVLDGGGSSAQPPVCVRPSL
jgi:hypothetical protein